MKLTGIILVIIIIACFVASGALADDDLVNKASNISIVVPTPGSAMLGTDESMNEFQGYLSDSGNQLIAFFLKIMGLFGMSDSNLAQNMQDTLQSGMRQGAGTRGGVQKTPAISPTAAPIPGSLMIRTTPGGVQVFLNDQLRGTTPEDSTKVLVINEIPPGSYSFELRKSGYSFIKESIQVSDGQWIVLSKELQAVPA